MQSLATEAAEVIRSGGIVLHPSDTVYGLACNAGSAEAVRAIALLKQRPADMPYIVLCKNVGALRMLVRLQSVETDAIVALFVGEPVTMILPSSENAHVEITGCGPTIAVRVPHHPFTNAMCAAAAVPLLSTSANVHGTKTPYSLLDMDQQILTGADVVIDGGVLAGAPSTILDLTGPYAWIVREGVVSRDEIVRRIGTLAEVK